MKKILLLGDDSLIFNELIKLLSNEYRVYFLNESDNKSHFHINKSRDSKLDILLSYTFDYCIDLGCKKKNELINLLPYLSCQKYVYIFQQPLEFPFSKFKYNIDVEKLIIDSKKPYIILKSEYIYALRTIRQLKKQAKINTVDNREIKILYTYDLVKILKSLLESDTINQIINVESEIISISDLIDLLKGEAIKKDYKISKIIH